jgi:hypothetical protein
MKKSVQAILAVFIATSCMFAQTSMPSASNLNSSKEGMTCVTLYPTQTASIATSYPTTVMTTYPDFLANDWTNGGEFTQRSMMQFDFSSIPNNSVIDSSLLSLYGHPTNNNPQGSSPLTGSNLSVLRLITDSWSSSTATWNNQPATTSLDSVILPESTSTMENYLNIDIKAMTNVMMGGNYGFMMSLDTEATYRCLLFASMYNSDSTVLPRLKVCYTASSGIPTLLSQNSTINIFPSPVSSLLNVEFNGMATENSMLQIFDITGRQQDSYMIPSGTSIEKIDVSSLAKGIYFIRVINAQTAEVKRFVKD